MHCISTYPMEDEDANLNCIKVLRKKFQCDVGYSGHEVGLAVSYAAAALGITSLEPTNSRSSSRRPHCRLTGREQGEAVDARFRGGVAPGVYGRFAAAHCKLPQPDFRGR